VSEPRSPSLVLEKKLGTHVNMVSQSWDGERVYFTSSVLANWDKIGEDRDQFFKAFDWDGKELTPRFEIDFIEAGLGRPHIMRFGAEAFGKGKVAQRKSSTYAAETR
jgi:selenium-binding protein 1